MIIFSITDPLFNLKNVTNSHNDQIWGFVWWTVQKPTILPLQPNRKKAAHSHIWRWPHWLIESLFQYCLDSKKREGDMMHQRWIYWTIWKSLTVIFKTSCLWFADAF